MSHRFAWFMFKFQISCPPGTAVGQRGSLKPALAVLQREQEMQLWKAGWQYASLPVPSYNRPFSPWIFQVPLDSADTSKTWEHFWTTEHLHERGGSHLDPKRNGHLAMSMQCGLLCLPNICHTRCHCLHPYLIQYSAGDIYMWLLGWPLWPSLIKSLYLTNLLWRVYVNSAFKDKLHSWYWDQILTVSCSILEYPPL